MKKAIIVELRFSESLEAVQELVAYIVQLADMVPDYRQVEKDMLCSKIGDRIAGLLQEKA